MSTQSLQRPFGAVPLAEGGVEFSAWVPSASRAAVRVGAVDHELTDAGDGVFAYAQI